MRRRALIGSLALPAFGLHLGIMTITVMAPRRRLFLSRRRLGAGKRRPHDGELRGPGVEILDDWLKETREGRAIVTLGFRDAGGAWSARTSPTAPTSGSGATPTRTAT